MLLRITCCAPGESVASVSLTTGSKLHQALPAEQPPQKVLTKPVDGSPACMRATDFCSDSTATEQTGTPSTPVTIGGEKSSRLSRR